MRLAARVAAGSDVEPMVESCCLVRGEAERGGDEAKHRRRVGSADVPSSPSIPRRSSALSVQLVYTRQDSSRPRQQRQRPPPRSNPPNRPTFYPRLPRFEHRRRRNAGPETLRKMTRDSPEMGERARLVGHKLLMSISCFASLGVFLVRSLAPTALPF